MSKRNFAGIVFIMLAVIAITTTQALAAGTSCTFVTANGASTGITMSAITDGSGNFPIKMTDPTTGGPLYIWAYQINGATPNQLNALEMVCPLDNGYTILSGGQVLAPGGGDSFTGFGVGDYQDQVVRMAAQQGSNAYGLPSGSYSFSTSRTGDPKNTSMAIKSSNATYYCPNIAGPSCYVPAEIGALALTRVSLEDPAVYIDIYYRGDGKFDHAVDWNGNPVTLNDLSTFVPGMTYAPEGTVVKLGNHSILAVMMNGGTAYKYGGVNSPTTTRPSYCPSSTCTFSSTNQNWNQMNVCPLDGSCIKNPSCPGTNYTSASYYAGACK